MIATSIPLLSLTAGDLMSREVKTIPVAMPLREAARELARVGVHGAPVVDEDGRCVGVLSVSNVARWVARQDDPSPPPPACSYQTVHREPGASETVLCVLRPGACALQRFQEQAGGQLSVVCADPHGVCTDWGVVEVESLPTAEVRRYMTTELATVNVGAPLADLARTMLDRAVHRVIVVDPERRPVGVVSVSDVLEAVVRTTSDAGDGG
jgi:CBS domain-containing protein